MIYHFSGIIMRCDKNMEIWANRGSRGVTPGKNFENLITNGVFSCILREYKQATPESAILNLKLTDIF